MEKEILFIEGRREAYAPDKIRHTMTVGELIAFLEDFDEDTLVMLNNDESYTYGCITENTMWMED